MAKTATAPRKSTSKTQAAKDAAAVKANLEKHEEHVITDEQRAADAQANETVKNDVMANFVNQLSGGAAPAVGTPPAAMDEFNAKLAALKKEFGVNVEVKVKPAKADKLQQHGVTRPAENTTCGKIWATADAISHQTHGVAAIAALKEHPAMKDVNDATLKTQYARWRQFNGITGRLPKLHAVHQQQGEYPGIPEMVSPKAE